MEKRWDREEVAGRFSPWEKYFGKQTQISAHLSHQHRKAMPQSAYPPYSYILRFEDQNDAEKTAEACAAGRLDLDRMGAKVFLGLFPDTNLEAIHETIKQQAGIVGNIDWIQLPHPEVTMTRSS